MLWKVIVDFFGPSRVGRIVDLCDRKSGLPDLGPPADGRLTTMIIHRCSCCRCSSSGSTAGTPGHPRMRGGRTCRPRGARPRRSEPHQSGVATVGTASHRSGAARVRCNDPRRVRATSGFSWPPEKLGPLSQSRLWPSRLADPGGHQPRSMVRYEPSFAETDPRGSAT